MSSLLIEYPPTSRLVKAVRVANRMIAAMDRRVLCSMAYGMRWHEIAQSDDVTEKRNDKKEGDWGPY